MKKALAIVLAVVLCFSLVACSSGSEDTKTNANTESTGNTTANTGSENTTANTETGTKETAEPVELIVFAAASMTETLTEIGNTYMAEHQNVTIQFNFDSSGTLKTQIQEGADCDIFISAGQKQVNQIDKNDTTGNNTEGLDLVLEGTRINLLENKVTLCVPDPSAADAVKSFDDLAEHLKAGDVLLCMGNSDVPVGQYTQKILAYYELSEEQLASAGNITYGSNVKEVTTQVSEGSVDAGVIYCTDAFSAGLEIVDYATAEMCGQIIYPACVINTTKNAEAAQEFLDYLTTDAAMEVFESVGFSAVK